MSVMARPFVRLLSRRGAPPPPPPLGHHLPLRKENFFTSLPLDF
jgi:hypothetical protein